MAITEPLRVSSTLVAGGAGRRVEPGGVRGFATEERFGYRRFTVDQDPKTLRAATCRFRFGGTFGTNSDCVEVR